MILIYLRVVKFILKIRKVRNAQLQRFTPLVLSLYSVRVQGESAILADPDVAAVVRATTFCGCELHRSCGC
jgi:hypothetical protein